MVFIKTYLQSINIHFDHIGCRLRCFGHVINLVVKAFLFGDGEDFFNTYIMDIRDNQLQVLFPHRPHSRTHECDCSTSGNEA